MSRKFYAMHNFIMRFLTGVVLGGLFWFSFTWFPPFYFSLVLFGILLCIIIFEWKRLFKVTKPLFWLVMPIYPILPFALLIYMNQHPLYHDLLFYLFILVFSFDTGSYLVGNLIGKHKIAPHISPGKTWEGLIGGYLFAIIGFRLMLWEQGIARKIPFILWYSIILSTLSLAGDLFESWLKRRARIKDSGNFLPGHGGFLDRFDGIMFVVFFFYFWRDYLVRIFDII